MRATEIIAAGSAEWYETLGKAYRIDPTFRDVVKAHDLLESGMSCGDIRKSVGPLALQITDCFKSKENLLMYQDERDSGEVKERLCVPRGEGLRESLIREAHETLLGGHFGIERTYDCLASRFYWPRMKASVKSYINKCETCHRVKASNQKPMGLDTLAMENQPWRAEKGAMFATRLNAIMKEARTLLQAAQDKQAAHENLRRRLVTIGKGDSVFLSTAHLPVPYANVHPTATALRHRYGGPLKIVEEVNPNAMRLDIPKDGDRGYSKRVKAKKGRNIGIKHGTATTAEKNKRKDEGVYEVEEVVDHDYAETIEISSTLCGVRRKRRRVEIAGGLIGHERIGGGISQGA